MKETWKTGTKVVFKQPEKYDGLVHEILNVQNTHNDVCYYLFNWSWIDEDELQPAEDVKITFNKGDLVVYKDQEEYGKALNMVDYTLGNNTYYVNGGFDESIDLLLYTAAQDNPVVELPIQSPTHYTSTTLTTLDVVNDWNLDFYLGNTVKYIQRHTLKGNAVQDLKKAAHYLQLYIDKLEKE